MAVIVITDENHRAKRIPAHWTDRKAAAHSRIDALLADWEAAPDSCD